MQNRDPRKQVCFSLGKAPQPSFPAVHKGSGSLWWSSRDRCGCRASQALCLSPCSRMELSRTAVQARAVLLTSLSLSNPLPGNIFLPHPVQYVYLCIGLSPAAFILFYFIFCSIPFCFLQTGWWTGENLQIRMWSHMLLHRQVLLKIPLVQFLSFLSKASSICDMITS